MPAMTRPLLDGGATRGRLVRSSCMHVYTKVLYDLPIVKEMKQKRRSSILETVVPRRFTTTSSSPRSPHRMTNLLKSPLVSKDSSPLPAEPESVAGTTESLATAAPNSSEEDTSPKLQHKKEDTSSVSDQKVAEQRWSVSDLPSLQLHNQEFPALVTMMEQVSRSPVMSQLLSLSVSSQCLVSNILGNFFLALSFSGVFIVSKDYCIDILFDIFNSVIDNYAKSIG